MSSTIALTATEQTRPSRSFSLRNTFRGGAKLPVPRPKTSESHHHPNAGSLRDVRRVFEQELQLPPFQPSSDNAKTGTKSSSGFGSTLRRLGSQHGDSGAATRKDFRKSDGGVGGDGSGAVKARAGGKTFSLSKSIRPARVGQESPSQPPVTTPITAPAKLAKAEDAITQIADNTRKSSKSTLKSPLTLASFIASDGKPNSGSSTSSLPGTSSSSSASSLDERGHKDGDSSTAASSITSTSSKAATRGKSAVSRQDISSTTRSGDALKKSRRGLNVFARSSASDTSSISRADSTSTMSDRSTSVGISAATFKKVKDEMWEPYKILENDYSKFQNKTSNAQKTQVIKQCLLPFLRKYKGRSYSQTLLPEELEKRTKTLHKWWTGLINHLKCRTTQAVSGADKPTYLEAVSYIISRPEWRSSPSTFAPLVERLSTPAKSPSSSSLSSNSSNYSIQKSVQHNIKVLFMRTLCDTLSYVVERLGFRTAPPPMVAFGGKVLAYAFFFCPGVADMLISLWAVKPTNLRRIPSQFGLERGVDMQSVSEAILCEFPETLHHLGFSSVAATIRQLRKPVAPPLAVQAEWEGPWLTRWCGRDSDLLFVFFKQYHILMCEFLPFDATPTARLCSPGYVPMLGQLLSLIDDTIHRQPSQTSNEPVASTTFEDLLNASAPLPLPPRNANNCARSMAENKLIVLVKDVLSDNLVTPTVRDAFVHSFAAMLKAAVERTQLHDGTACFQICDIMEELVPVFKAAEDQGKGEFIDWPFWLKVTKLMLESESNTTELRIISLVYSIYDTLAADEERKRTVVLEWLLSASVWERFFCHWCPMARAYFMRLACWRIARFNGEGTDVDVEIYNTVWLRLRTGFVHHVKLKELNRFSSTTPCLPAPSRRLVILRNDTIATPQGVLLDGLLPTSFAAPQGLMRSGSSTSLASLAEVEAQLPSSDVSVTSTASNASAGSTVSKGWIAIRSAFSFKNSVEDLDSRRPSPPPSKPGSRDGSISERQLIKVAHFKFSLEYLERPSISRDRPIGIPRLPMSTWKFLEKKGPDTREITVTPSSLAQRHWTYVGRALAEWTTVVVEYENFFERRKMEGREAPQDVETPALVVDSLRKL